MKPPERSRKTEAATGVGCRASLDALRKAHWWLGKMTGYLLLIAALAAISIGEWKWAMMFAYISWLLHPMDGRG